MRKKPGDLRDEYISALQSYVQALKESDLQQAYELGRLALTEGVGLLDLVTYHHAALNYCFLNESLARDRIRTIRAAERFFIESLAPFEMSVRGYKEAYTSLKISEEKYRILVENASDIVFSTDMEKNLVSINKAMEEITGYTREEVIGMNLDRIVSSKQAGRLKEMIERKLDGDGTTTYELEIVHKLGHIVPLEVSSQLLKRDGKTVGVQGIARNIGDRKQAEAAMMKFNVALEEQAKRIAHELHDESGQLLASVHIALEEVAREVGPNEKKAIDQVKGLLNQIESELRRFSHELRPTILDDLGLVQASEFLAQGVSQRSHLPIFVEGDTEGRLPAQVEIALYRVVQEALNNAVRHSHAKDVRVSILRNGKHLNCTISDNGVGFETLKDKFNFMGRGLGLVGMRERLAAVGGKLVVRSGPGQGTDIVATVPVESLNASQSNTG